LNTTRANGRPVPAMEAVRIATRTTGMVAIFVSF
jgi:hypothetical protein